MDAKNADKSNDFSIVATESSILSKFVLRFSFGVDKCSIYDSSCLFDLILFLSFYSIFYTLFLNYLFINYSLNRHKMTGIFVLFCFILFSVLFYLMFWCDAIGKSFFSLLIIFLRSCVCSMMINKTFSCCIEVCCCCRRSVLTFTFHLNIIISKRMYYKYNCD